MATAKPVRSPLDSPLAAPRPAGGPGDAVVRATVRRKPVVNFHARMVRGKVYPLTVQLRDEGGGARAAINGDGSHGGSVTVLPIIPGAIVTPPSMEISTATGSEARFWVTPLALGKLRDARIELRTGSTIHETVPLLRRPDWLVIIIGLLLTGPIIPVLYFLSYSKYPKVRRGWWPWILLTLTFLLPLLLFFAKEYQWTPSVRLHIEKSKAAAGKSLDEGAPAQPNNEANPMGGVRPNDREPPPAKTEDKPKDETKPEEAKKEESKKEEGNKEEEKKPDAPKPAEDKKEPEKKEEDKKPDDKRSEDKPADDGLLIDDSPEHETYLALSWAQPGSDEDKPAGATKDDAKTPPAKRPGGPGQGGAPRGGRAQGQPPGGGSGRPAGGPPAPPGLPPPPADGGVEPPKVTYFGEDAINRGLDYEMKRREGTKLEDYDTKDLAVYGLASVKDYLAWGYRNLYELPRNMQYSELILFALLAILTAVYCTLFGPARARRVGRVIELPAA